MTRKIISIFVITFVCCVFFTSAVKAQEFRFGLRGGLAIANQKIMNVGSNLSSKATRGATVGVGVEVPFSDYVLLQPEIVFTQKGNTLRETVGNLVEKNERQLNYLEVPVVIKGTFGANKKGVSVIAGLGGAYALNGTIRLNNNQESDFDFGQQSFERLESLMIFGLGFYEDVPGGRLTIEGRFQGSLNNLDQSNRGEVKNRVFTITAGYYFNMDR